jgi:hypothetical protein
MQGANLYYFDIANRDLRDVSLTLRCYSRCDGVVQKYAPTVEAGLTKLPYSIPVGNQKKNLTKCPESAG